MWGSLNVPYEFRAKEIDDHQEQSYMAKQSLASDEDQEQERAVGQSSTDKERPSEIHSGNSTVYSGNPSDEAWDPEKKEEALEDHLGMEQDIVPHIRSSYSTNLVAKVRLADNLLSFRFG